jgi:integrase
MKLTTRRIDELSCPDGKKDKFFFDGEQRGLGVRVTASGGKTFVAQYTIHGAKRHVPIGSCSAISLAAARSAVQAIMGAVAHGRDPAAERKEKAIDARRRANHEALTLGALLESWEALHLADKRPRYRAEALRVIKYAFRDHLKTPAAELTRATVVRVLDGIAKDGAPAMARRTAGYSSACYAWAVKRGSLTANPFLNLPLAPIATRDRVLTDDELRAIWLSTEGPGPYNAIVRMLLLTGQRREEVGSMTWDEISPDLATWTIPASRAKNGAAHLVPLSLQAQAVIRAAPRPGDTLVFPGLRGAYASFSAAKLGLDLASGVRDWHCTISAARWRQACSGSASGSRSRRQCSITSPGSRAGIVGVYQRHTWADEKRAALSAWSEYVSAIVRDEAENVTPLRRSV